MNDKPPRTAGAPLTTREAVILIAALMAMNALAIDTMLPALPQIGAALGVVDENQRQQVIVAFMAGFGATQILWGPLSDRYGRRGIVLSGIALYVLFALLCALATSFPLLIAARFAMGAAAAVNRVLVAAIVRDLFAGSEMARVMSLAFMVFMVVPMIAPTLGQGILMFGDWRMIFLVLAGYGLLLALWTARRLPETLRPEYRRRFAFAPIVEAARITLSDRLSLGYTIAMACFFGGLTAYVVSIQQIVFDIFGAPEKIGIVFASVAAPMCLLSWLNSRIVRRYGAKRVSHAGLVAYLALVALHLVVARDGESLVQFVVLAALANGMFAFTSANFGSLAMANMASVAGTASSIQGSIGSLVGAIIGYAIGQHFDGTLTPFLLGSLLCGCASLVAVLWTERGRLFPAVPREASEAPPIEPDELPLA